MILIEPIFKTEASTAGMWLSWNWHIFKETQFSFDEGDDDMGEPIQDPIDDPTDDVPGMK